MMRLWNLIKKINMAMIMVHGASIIMGIGVIIPAMWFMLIIEAETLTGKIAAGVLLAHAFYTMIWLLIDENRCNRF